MVGPYLTRRELMLAAGAALGASVMVWRTGRASTSSAAYDAPGSIMPPHVDAEAPSAYAATEAGQPRELVVPVISRSSWRARKPRPGLRRHRPKRLTLHHTGVVLTDDRLSPARVRAHQNYYMDSSSLRFPDLPYHFMVDRRGNVFQGRDPDYRGDTATEYRTTGHFLVACEGDYDQQRRTRAQLRSMVAVFAWACQEYGIDPATLRGHQDYARTACPGWRLEALVRNGTLAARVARISRRRAVKLQYLKGREGRRVVAAIERGR